MEAEGRYIEVEAIGLNLKPLIYSVCEGVSLRLYDVVQVTIGRKGHLALVTAVFSDVPEGLCGIDIKVADLSDFYYTDIQKVLLGFMSSYYLCSLGVSSQVFTLACNIPLEDSLSRGAQGHFAPPCSDVTLNELSAEQESCFSFLKGRSLGLIFGDTGSGKTEVYLHLIRDELKRGKQSLILMPEISLTPQIQRKLEDSFPDMVGIWHSKLRKKQKDLMLHRLISGKIRVIAGARSALFLPYEDLGLIVVDEEHDDAYKATSRPRYNARDLSMFLSNKGVRVVLGSATPSAKSYYLAMKNGYLFRISKKFFSSEARVIFEHSKTQLTDGLIGEIAHTLSGGKQVIIFLPTRANFKKVICGKCGKTVICPHCNVSLSIHLKKNALVCHYCNHHDRIPAECPHCGNGDLIGKRIGTQELQKQLQEFFPGARVEIFDRDHVTTQSKLEKILDDFNEHRVDILVGTQMISKGHDYHNISLSIILGIDHLLYDSDYRAFEKTMSLVYQVAGRSSRKEDGTVFIQTVNVAMIDRFYGLYEKVLRHELEMRRGLYPPFTKLVKLSISNSKEDVCKGIADSVAKVVSEVLTEHNLEAELVGVCEAAMFKVNKKYFYNVLVRSKHVGSIRSAVVNTISRLSSCMPKSIPFIDVDVDPIDF